jgi:carbon monoxide dehydrogenase subunit G
MKLRETFELAQPVASVWTFFDRPEAVAGCVPGVEQLTATSPDAIDVTVTQSVGPMRATFAATITIVERVPEKLISFTAIGKTVRGAMGNVRASVTVQLEPSGSGTVVIVEGDVVLAGALGSVGQKVVSKQAGKVTAQFARNLEVALGGSPAAVPARRPAPGQRTAPQVGASAAAHAASPGPVGERQPVEGRWAVAAVALSAVSVVLGAVSVALGAAALRRAPRRGCR